MHIKKLLTKSIVLFLVVQQCLLSILPAAVYAVEDVPSSMEVSGTDTTTPPPPQETPQPTGFEDLPTPSPSPSPIPSLIESTPAPSMPTPSASPTVSQSPVSEFITQEQDRFIVSQSSTPVASASIRRKPTLRSMRKSLYRAREPITVTVDNEAAADIHLQLSDPDGKNVSMRQLVLSENNPAIIRIQPPRSFKPGRWRLIITDQLGVVGTQDFEWGVLAINTDQSVYTPESTAHIAMAVLDSHGEMVCDANTVLTIENTQADFYKKLTTEDGSIRINPECTLKKFTLIPDYESQARLGGVGVYTMKLTATTPEGTKTLEDSFEVRETVPFTVVRKSATRLYPPETYPMSMTVTASEDFSGTITETVPSSFTIEQPNDDALRYTSVEYVAAKPVEEDPLVDIIPQLYLPYDEGFPITLRFGEQLWDTMLKKQYSDFGLLGHDGVDIALMHGSPVYAADDGVIVRARKNYDYGTTIVVQHAWGRSYYGHLSHMIVDEGDRVTKGTEIAKSGNTGLSTGAHLHFGIKPNQNNAHNGYFGKINPLPYILPQDVTSSDSALTVGESESVHIISWRVDVKKGEQFTIGYRFKAPYVSPQFYTLGPAEFIADSKVVFREPRSWQLANDSVNFYSSVTTSTAGAGTNQSSFSHTIPSGPNRILVVAVSTEDVTDADRVVSSVAWNTSETLTAAIDQQNDTSDVGVHIYYLINPTATTANVVVNFAGSVTSIGVTAMNLYNAVQSSPVDASTSNNQDNTGTPNLSVSTNSDYAMVIGALTCNANATAYVATQTQRSHFSITAARALVSSIQKDTAGSQNIGWTAGSAGNDNAQAVVAFKTITNSIHILETRTTSTAGAGTNQSSFSHTVPSTGTNRLLAVAISTEDVTDADRVISSVTWNTTETLTAARNQQNDTSDVGANIYYRINPTATTANVVVNFAGSVTSIGATAINLTGVDQTSPLDANNGANQDNTASPTVSTTTNSSSAFLVSVDTNNAATALLSAQDERADFSITNAESIVSIATGGSAGSHTMNYSGGGATDDHAQAVAAFKLASSGPTLDQLMRFGKWFNGTSEQPFTF